MLEPETKLRDGDIYRWCWKDETYRSYHCYSRIAVVKNHELYDTYWGESLLQVEDVCLTYLGNKADLIEISEYDTVFYRSSDIIDMRHENASSAPIYLRRAAKRDMETTLAHFKQKIHETEVSLDFYARKLDHLREIYELAKIGRLDDIHL